jgi:predicted HicB family RNase H-like nuclease
MLVKEKEFLGIRVAPEVKRRIEEDAKRQQRSVQFILAYVLERVFPPSVTDKGGV